MYGLDMELINKVFYAGMAFCAASAAIPIVFEGRTKSATGGVTNDLEDIKGKDGFIIGKNKIGKKYQLSWKSSLQNVIVIGPPGQHKTTPFVYTQLLINHFPINTSIVINDSKGELWRDTSCYQKSIGRKIFLFEPLGTHGHYNPLEWAETYSEVEKLAKDILMSGTLAIKLDSGNGGGSFSSNDAFWIQAATALLAASLFYHKDLKRPHNTISEAVDFLISNEPEDIEIVFGNSKNQNVVKQFNIFNMSVPQDEDSSGGPLTSILSTLATNTKFWLDPQIASKTSYSDFNYKMLRDERVSLYIKYFPEDSNYLSPLMSIMYTQLIEKCKKYYDNNKNNIVWLLDEAQNLGRIPTLAQTVNSSRESNYAFLLVLQSVSALIDVYGRNGTRSILNAMQTKCILPAYSEVEMLREFTTLNGDKEIPIVQGNRTVKMKKNVFTPDEIRRLKKDEVLIISQNLKPILAKQYRYYEDKAMLLNKNMKEGQ